MTHPVRVEIHQVMAYTEADAYMRELQARRIENEIGDVLLFLEHPEIVTVGPKARNEGLHPPKDYATHVVDRGGGLTWHGPGQLVVYPIFLWELDDERSVQDIISKIEQWVIDTLKALGIDASRDSRMQGVWVDGFKICSIGLSFLRWVSRHGFTINYNTPEGRVEGVQGCGLDAQTTTSLHKLGYTVERDRIVESLLKTMPDTLQRKLEEIKFLDASS